MTQQKKKYNKIGSLCWAIKKLWRVDWHFVVFVFANVPVEVVLPLLESYFIKSLIDQVGMGVAFAELTITVVCFLAVITLLSILNSYIVGKCSGRQYYPTMIYQLEMIEFAGYRTDYENTEKQEYDRTLNYVATDACTGNCSLEYLWEDLQQCLIHLFGIVTYASLLTALHPLLLVVVTIVSLLSYVTTRWQPAYYEKNKDKWEKEGRKKGYLEGISEDFGAAKDIKLYGFQGWLEKMMQDYQNYILMWNKKCSLRGIFAAVLAGLMTFVQNAAAYIVLIGGLLAGNLTVGEFVFYFGLVGSISGFMQGIVGDVAKLSTRADKIAYYRDLYDYPNKFNHGEGCALPTSSVEIEFKDVWYSYDGAKEATLKGVNLKITAGESLALVGMNGAGKTTLIKLLCGFYAPTKGDILVNGRSLKEYNIEEYYSLISAVFQEVKAVAFSVFEFVASVDMKRPTAREDAVRAMKAAGIWEKVESLPNGMDTHLMKGIFEDGVDFSGGQMQKLVLARAIYKDGLILVLDEPTAALDPIAENELYLKYRELTMGKTSVYISHRFASTRFCDRIVLLEDGVITESGSHDELMELNGQYAYMFGVQSKYYKEGEINE